MLFLNGQRVGTDRLTPAPTDFTRSVAYDSYDVTTLLEARNAIGAVVSAGYFFAPRQQYQANVRTSYGLPRLRLNLIIDYADGHRETIRTDTTWRMNTDGPLRYSNIYDGEFYDSRLEFADWIRPGFDDGRWTTATRCQKPGGEMRGHTSRWAVSAQAMWLRDSSILSWPPISPWPTVRAWRPRITVRTDW